MASRAVGCPDTGERPLENLPPPLSRRAPPTPGLSSLQSTPHIFIYCFYPAINILICLKQCNEIQHMPGGSSDEWWGTASVSEHPSAQV